MYLIAAHNGIKEKGIKPINVEKDYPSVFKHLKQFETELKKRHDKGDHWTNLRNCAYWEEFDNTKIVWQELSRTGSAFCYLEGSYFVNNTIYVMTSNSKEDLQYITAILNSKISLFYLETVYNKLDETGWRWFKIAVEQIPIPEPSISIRQKVIELVQEIQHRTKNQQSVLSLMTDIENIIYKLYDFTSTDINALIAKLPVLSQD